MHAKNRGRTVAEIVDEALRLTTGTVPDLAREVGASRNSLHAWARGDRNPTSENRKKLAEALWRRGGKLSKLAEELEGGIGRIQR